MHKRTIHVFIRSTVLSCVAMALLSACSIFQANDWSRYTLSPEASSRFMRSIRPFRGDVEPHYLLACYFQERKKHILALEEFRTAVEIDPTYVKAYNGMGVSYDSLGDHDRAVGSYKAALKVNQKLDYVLNNLGYAYLLQGNLDSAIGSFQKAVALNEKNPRYHNNLGLAYAKSGKYDQAFVEFRLAGDEAQACRNMARFFYRNGLYDDAAAQFSRALAMNPSCKDTQKCLKAAGSLAGILATPVKEENKRLDEVDAGLSENSDEAAKSTTVSMKESESFCALAVQMKDAEMNNSNEEKRIESKQFEVDDGSRKSENHRIVIEVSNGNGVSRMARKVGNYLNTRGFKLMYLSNAANFNHLETTIYYCKGHLQDAQKAAQKLPGRQNIEMVSYLEWEKAEIKVLIGKDLISHINLFI